MPILALGVSYRRAPVDLLERLAFGADDLPKAYRRLRELDDVAEGVIVSTCNRVEVYAEVASYHAGFLDLKRFVSESREVAPEEFADPLYSHYEEDAAEHLFTVASGLDSMLLGEPQILSQVRQAYRRAEEEGAAGPVTASVFRSAVRTGRRARAETAIGASPAGFVEAGIDLAEEALGGLAERSAVVVGAGEMARLALRHLRERGIERVRVLNRSVERAARVAAATGADHAGLDSLERALEIADLLISSTGATGTVVGVDTVRSAMSSRPDRPLFVIDLAVPRDVDPGVARLPGVRVAAIDDLRQSLAARAAPAAEIERARSIVRQEVERFAAWRRAARLAPLIQALRARGERIEAAELARVLPRLSRLDERERAVVESLASGIVAKLLHEPIVRLRGPGATDALARALAELFALDPNREG
jgi:glutamyl-tRNA reductase